MGFFKKNKKQTSEKVQPQWHKTLKRTSYKDQDKTQQDFIFSDKSSDYKDLGTKNGLSKNISSEQVKVLKKCDHENTAMALMKILKRSNKTKFKQTILSPLIEFGFFEQTIPDKPKSPKQKYRLTGKFIQKRVDN